MKTKLMLVLMAGMAIGTAMAATVTNAPVNLEGVAGTGAPAKVSLVLTLIPIIVPVLIALLKFLLPRLPKAWIPILAPLLGAGVDLLCGGSWGAGTIMAAIAGSAGVGLREIVDQLKKSQAQQ